MQTTRNILPARGLIKRLPTLPKRRVVRNLYLHDIGTIDLIKVMINMQSDGVSLKQSLLECTATVLRFEPTYRLR